MNKPLNLENILNSIKGNLGEDDYLEPLEMLISSLNNEANLSYFGALGAKFQISNHLKTRAKLFDYEEMHKKIINLYQEEISKKDN